MAAIEITGLVDTSTWPADHFDPAGLLGLSPTGHQRLMATRIGAFTEWELALGEAQFDLEDLSTQDLVARLDAPARNDSDDACHVLIQRGPVVVEAVLAATAGMGTYGKRSAIEVLTALPDADAGPVLIDLLGDTDDVVRTWAAELLGSLGHTPAIPALRARYARVVEERVPLDWMEPVALRDALSNLGARDHTIPALTASLASQHGRVTTWPATTLRTVADDLADHDLLLLVGSVQFWDINDDGTPRRSSEYATGRSTPTWPVHWSEAVDAARHRAHHLAALIPQESTAVITLDWLVRSDVDGT